ncbi:hypothetical protein RhiJN_05107 [Ceratobasidium sp. AG-Ba]|nr:hypothetical protein RhiJN_05107 [Ceratobasidium sp. AG-Ba]
MAAQIKSGNYRLTAMNNECLTMSSDKEGKRLTISPLNWKNDQIFQINFQNSDSSVTLKSVEHGLYVSCDNNPTAYSGIHASRSAQKFKLEAGSRPNQRRLYVKGPLIKLYMWYSLSRAPINPPQAGLIPDNPGIALKNWRLEAVDTGSFSKSMM